MIDFAAAETTVDDFGFGETAFELVAVAAEDDLYFGGSGGLLDLLDFVRREFIGRDDLDRVALRLGRGHADRSRRDDCLATLRGGRGHGGDSARQGYEGASRNVVLCHGMDLLRAS